MSRSSITKVVTTKVQSSCALCTTGHRFYLNNCKSKLTSSLATVLTALCTSFHLIGHLVVESTSHYYQRAWDDVSHVMSRDRKFIIWHLLMINDHIFFAGDNLYEKIISPSCSSHWTQFLLSALLKRQFTIIIVHITPVINSYWS